MRSSSRRPLCRPRAVAGAAAVSWLCRCAARTPRWPVPRLLALVALLVLPLSLLTPAAARATLPASAVGAAAAHAEGDFDLALTGLSPSYVSSGGTVSLSVSITNASTAPLNQAVVRAYLSTSPFITRFSVSQWESTALGQRRGESVGEQAINTLIPVGGSLSTTFVSTPLNRSGSGPYGLVVSLIDPESGETLSEQRSFVVVNPPSTSTKVSVVVPLVNPDPVGTAAFAVTESGVTEPSPELLQRAEAGVHALSSGAFASAMAVAQVPGITWTLDPSLVLDTSVLSPEERTAQLDPDAESPAATESPTTTTPTGATEGQPTGAGATNPATGASEPDQTPSGGADTPSEATTTTPSESTTSATAAPSPSATTLAAPLRDAMRGVRDALVAGAQGRDIYGGDFASLPLAQVRSASDQAQYAQVQQWSTEAWEDLGTAPRGTLGSLALDTVSTTALSQWQRAGATQMLLPDVTVAPMENLTFTPTGLARLNLGGATFSAALSDSPLSSDLADFETLDGGIVAQQRMLADLAVISSELPETQRSVVIAAPRNWSPQVLSTKAALGQIFSAPWVEVQPLSDLFETPVNVSRAPPQAMSETRSGFFDPVPARSIVPDAGPYVESAQRIEQASAFESMLSAGASLEPLQRLSFAAIAASASAPDQSVVNLALESISAAVTPTAPAKVNFVAESGNIPVSIRNSLNTPITLRLKVVPDLPLLRSDRTISVQLAPQETRSVTMPIVALANGDTSVIVEVLDADGNTVAASVPFTVSVRAQWEGLVTYIVVGLIAGLLIYGFLRRRFTSKRTTLESR
ncbi:hypothetical protein JT358_07830 [Micrococcales bacterium 31B]|nr:hypothetical protein [Micrococcales bacterium 31B]